MNILKRELKAGLKPFLFWALGIFVLVFAGVAKYTGISAGSEQFATLVETFPRIVRAVMGMEGMNLGTFGGYYAVLAQYAAILTAVYAAHLGNNAVSREAVDKTYEFVFTKPRTRSFILMHKLLAGGIYLAAFCALNFVFSVAAVSMLDLQEDMTGRFLLFAIAVFLAGLVFFALAAMFAAAARNTEAGAKLGNVAVLLAFVLGVVYDMMENGGVVRLFSPLKYFLPDDLLAGRLDPLSIGGCVAIAGIALAVAFARFEKRDLGAV